MEDNTIFSSESFESSTSFEQNPKLGNKIYFRNLIDNLSNFKSRDRSTPVRLNPKRKTNFLKTITDIKLKESKYKKEKNKLKEDQKLRMKVFRNLTFMQRQRSGKHALMI